MATIADLRKLVSETKPEEAAAMTSQLLAEGEAPMKVLEDGVMRGLSEVGDRFAAGEAIVLDLVRAGVTAKSCVPIIQEALPVGSTVNKGKKIILGTMLSQHNIGKNLVSTLLSIAGYDVIDIGEKNSPMNFYEKAESERADMIAVSVVFAPAMEKFSELIALLEEFGVRDKYPVIVGGAVTTQEWADAEGADGWGQQAKHAVDLAKKFLRIEEEAALG